MNRNLENNNYSGWMDLQYVGFKANAIPAFSREMLFGGKTSMQIGGTPLTGQVMLSVTMGGLRKKEIPSDVKRLFKKDIVPVLVKYIHGFDTKYSGVIVLHFNDGIMTNFILTT